MNPSNLKLYLKNNEVLVFDWDFVESVYVSEVYHSNSIDKEGNQMFANWCKQFNIVVIGVGGSYVWKDCNWKDNLEAGDIDKILISYDNGVLLEYLVDWSKNNCCNHKSTIVKKLSNGLWSIQYNTEKEN